MLLVGVCSGRDSAAAEPRQGDNQHFTIDPVVDGVVTFGSAGFSELLHLILTTGEIQPTPPGDPHKLLAIDRIAVTQNIDRRGETYSNIGLWTAFGYAVMDPIVSGVRNGRRALLVDAIMYAESIAVSQAVTETMKIAVRRPRPIDYAACGADTRPAVGTNCANTDLQLSFFSGHAATTAAIGATATYLAFVRHGSRGVRPWITLAAGTVLTAFVSYQRVRSGEHFPTDVMMGSLAGGAIGVLVPHLHRWPHLHGTDYEAPPVWIGFAPLSRGGTGFTIGANF